MALYAFDGTGNEDKPGEDEDTNVLKFYRAYVGANGAAQNCFYLEGVGTRHGLLGLIFGGAFGAGGRERISEAMDRLEENFANGDRTIDVIGFSRGATLALEFANEIHDNDVTGVQHAKIRFLGIWDTVASFGLPGNNVNVGYNLTVPGNVATCRHAVSLDERRQTFPLTRVIQDKFSNRELLDIQAVWFRGYHSDVGGGNKNMELSDIALYWMYRRALDCGLELDDASIESAKSGRDSQADGKTPAMDRVPQKKRTVRDTDLVHDSVFRRGNSGRFSANNPPKGLRVTNDDGEVLAQRFEE